MKYLKKTLFLLFLFTTSSSFSQLGFCGGSKGVSIFSENFGNGPNYGPALPFGITNYTFISGTPNDGYYTLFYRTNLYPSWHYSLDHTPDSTNGTNGKSLIVNANANASGEFYKRVVTGLCVNTTFEFSAWVMNLYNPSLGACGNGEIPINVQFEIWNDTETVLLRSGNTGNILGNTTPNWRQFALVFTTVNETSVILKMKNNGLGGCGNDLAIDDIEFKSCGDLTTIENPLVPGNSVTTCESSVSVTLQAATIGGALHFYQWQSSTDGINWFDIPGATQTTWNATNVSLSSYFRMKVAQDVVNLNNTYCSTLSNVYTVSIISPPINCISTGNQVICSNQPIPPLRVTPSAGTGINWYDAPTNGTLLLSNSATFTPTIAGVYYAETYLLASNCINSIRIPVQLTIVSQPTATISVPSLICKGTATAVTINGTPFATVLYNIDGLSNQAAILDAGGSIQIQTPILQATSSYNLVSVSINSCTTLLNNSAVINVKPDPFAVISGNTTACYGSNIVFDFTGTPMATVTYSVNNGANQTLILNTSGVASVTIPNATISSVCNLVNVTDAGVTACTSSVTQALNVAVVPLPVVTIYALATAVCSNQPAKIVFNGTPNAIVVYSEDGGINQSITLNNLGEAIIITNGLTASKTFQLIRITLTGSANCTRLLSANITVTILPLPIVTVSGNLNYCSNDTTAISLNAALAGTTFSWNATPNGIEGASSGVGNQIIQTILNNTFTTDSVTYLVTPSSNGCLGLSQNLVVTVAPRPSPGIINGTICLNPSNSPASQYYTLTTNLPPTTFNFAWYFQGNPLPNATGSNYNAYQIGTYSVAATHLLSGCVSNRVAAQVSESVPANNLLINQSLAFSDSPSITITVIGGSGPFLYQIDNANFQTANVFNDVAPGQHTITVVDESYCTNLTATATIINYPYCFSPNEDGINDTWNIKGVNGNARIVIFDRYGKCIKQISPNSSGWDGTFNGYKMTASDYWFTIDYLEEGKEKTFRAHFTLKR